MLSPTRSVDEGWAWVIGCATCSIMFCVGGIVGSFAVLYVGLIDEYTTTSSSNATNNISNYSTSPTSIPVSTSSGISWVIALIGTLCPLMCCVFAPIVTFLQGRFGPQLVLFSGTASMVSGLLLTSFTNAIWQLFLTYSVLIGVGYSIIWTTALSLLPHYFQRRLVMACSLGVTGRFVGVACVTPVARIVMNLYGWRRMLQMSALLGVPMSICSALFRPPATAIEPQKMGLLQRVVKFCKLQKNVRLTFFSWLTAVDSIGAYIPMIYIIEYAEESLKVDADQSGFLLTGMFVAAAVSSPIAGVIGMRLKCNMFLVQLFAALCGLSSLPFPLFHSYFHVMVYMCIQGIAFARITLFPIIPVSTNMVCIRDSADAFGLLTFLQSSAFLAVPLAGWLYDNSGSYTPGFLLGAGTSVCVSLLLFLDRCLKKVVGDPHGSSHEQDSSDVTCKPCPKASEGDDNDVRTTVYYESYV